MLRTLFVAAVLLGASPFAHAEPEFRTASKETASKAAGALKKGGDALERLHPGTTEDTTRAVRVDDVDVMIPLLKGYRDLSGLPDAYRSLFERMLPDSMLLLDAHLHEAIDTMGIHSLSPHAQYEIYVAEGLKSMRLGPKEWREFRNEMSTALRSTDMTPLLERNETRVNAALDEHGVEALRIDDLRAGKPSIYRSDDRSLRVVVTLSNQQTIEGKLYEIEEVRATANLFVKGKVFIVVASREFLTGTAKPLEVAAVLDAYVDRVLALNP